MPELIEIAMLIECNNNCVKNKHFLSIDLTCEEVPLAYTNCAILH